MRTRLEELWEALWGAQALGAVCFSELRAGLSTLETLPVLLG